MAVKEKGRSTYGISCTGVTGSGKSYKAKEVAKKIAKSSNNKVLVITPSGSGKSWDNCKEIAPTKKDLSFKSGWKKILYKKHFSRKNKIFPIQKIFEYFKNGIVIFDDCKSYMSSDWERTPGLVEFLGDHRHNGVDFFFIAHQPAHIPVQVWTYITSSFVFACPFKVEERHINNANVSKFLKAQKEINKEFAKKYKELNRGKGTKDKPVGIYKYLDLSMF